MKLQFGYVQRHVPGAYQPAEFGGGRKMLETWGAAPAWLDDWAAYGFLS
jgi:hypothetical protein